MSTDHRAEVARVLGLLLLRELDEETLRALSEPTLAAALNGVGIEIPTTDGLEELAAEYFEFFINPGGGTPLVQSLCEGGSYEGNAARGIREVAEAAGVELNDETIRGAPVDHLAVQLFLWSELADRDPAAAAEFARRHLAWSVRVLRGPERRGFYEAVCHVVADFVELITEPSR